MPTGLIDGQTDGRQTVTLRFPSDAARVKSRNKDTDITTGPCRLLFALRGRTAEVVVKVD